MNKEATKILDDLSDQIESHVAAFEAHQIKQSNKFDMLCNLQQSNTEAISNLTASVSSLVHETSAIIKLHKDFQGAVRIGGGMQRFMVWMLRWGAIGAAVVATVHYITKHFNE